MFRASSAHPQEVNVVNCTCMQPLVFSFCKSELLLYCAWNMLSFCYKVNRYVWLCHMAQPHIPVYFVTK